MYRLIIFLLVLSASCFAQVPIDQKKSSDYMYYFEKGEQLLRESKYEEALVNINEALNINALYPDSYYTRGAIKEKLNDKEGALRDYTIYLELQPNQFDVLFRKALINFELEKWTLANEDFKQLISLPAGETTSIYFRQDRFIAGTNQVFTSQNPDKSFLFNYLGLTFFKLKDFPSALVYFDSALYHNPDEADYLVNAARCYEALKQNEKARSAYQTALTIHPDHAVAKHNLSALNRKDGAYLEAAQLLDDVINKNPNLPYPYAERAFYEMNNGELSKALADYNEAIRLAPKVAAYRNNRGMVKEKLKDWDGAYDDYSQSIRLNEKDEKVWLNRGNLFFTLEKYEESIKDYDVAIILYESYASAFYNRALAKHMLKNDTDACRDLKRAQSLGFDVKPKVISKICKNQ